MQDEEYTQAFDDENDVEVEMEDEREPNDKIKKLRTKLRECEQEKGEYLEGWQRVKADLVNIKKEMLERENRAEERGCERIVEAVAPVLDSFDMAMSGESWEHVDEGWRNGVAGIHTQLTNALQANGLTIIDPTGEAFNPLEHESVSIEHVEDTSLDNMVTQTLQKGLKVNDRIIRAAKVVVGSTQ